jgi:hypothetical protein
MARSLLSRPLAIVAEALDRRVGWDRLPLPLGLLTLLGLRHRLQSENLQDTGVPQGSARPAPRWNARYETVRTLDGTFNDRARPLMGSAGSRFGRNIPLEHTSPEELPRLLQPSPRRVSRELMTRDRFLPATTLNVLAAAWIQFEVHDWVFHGIPEDEEPWELALANDDPWTECPMRINRTRPDPQPDSNGGAPTWASTETHWWDGSQVYGLDDASAARLRTGELGKLWIDERGLPPRELDEGLDYRGIPGSLWIGLAILHSLFVREHNVICDHLHSCHPELSDDELYDRARLVVAALMAKIHTVEWTPAIIAHPTTVRAMHTQWWGLLGERFHKRFGRHTRKAFLHGIPGTTTSLHGVPYALTEEFVAVYRMHPLIPDEFTFRSVRTDEVLQQRTFEEVAVLQMRRRLEELEMRDAVYSLGVAHPGAITLHNYPRFLQHFNRADGVVLDLAAIDILRMRERGVPRYNEFRRFLHKRPVASFEELAGNPETAQELRRVYDGDLDSVDLMVGLFAEPKPGGFGFSDTAFRIFILMATRRLESDRFFTVDYRPEVYTQEGLDWIDRNSMRSLLLRHFPELEPALRGVANAFAPWRRVGA